MGLIIGLITSFIGIGLLLIPFFLNIYIDTRLKFGATQADIDKYKKWAKTSSIIIIISVIILLISVVMIWVYGEKKGEKKEGLLETTSGTVQTLSGTVQNLSSLKQGYQTLKGGKVQLPSLGSSGSSGVLGRAKSFFSGAGSEVEEVGEKILPYAEEGATVATEIA